MEAVQMLQRFTQVGEFYVMTKPDGAVDGMKGAASLLIFDEEADRHVKISYMDALYATGLVVPEDASASPAQMDPKSLKTGGTLKDGTAIAANAGAYQTAAGNDIILEGGTKLEDWVTGAIALAIADRDGGGMTAAGNYPIVLARPFIEHAMLSAVLTVSGGDTGATIFGPSDMYAAQHTLKTKLTNSRSMLPTPPHIQLLNGVHVISQANLGQHLCQDDRRVCLPF
jgi:hypothetical protein